MNQTIVFAALLFLVQVLVALPWFLLLFHSPRAIATVRKYGSVIPRRLVTYGVVIAAIVLIGPSVLVATVKEKEALESAGQLFAAAVQISLFADLFILAFWVLLQLWPKGGAIARAAFLEGVRQPLFWLIFGIGLALLTISSFLPYFTFGEDYVMVKELGYDTIMLCAVLFGAFAASVSISEEIEGRTAVTLMSKPVSRRDFLLGKFCGILLASAMMIALLGTWFEGVLLHKRWFDKMDPEPPALWIIATLDRLQLPAQASDLLGGVLLWANHTWETLPGLIMCSANVMVLVALAVALATRLPMVVNMSTVLVVYFLANLAPVLVEIGNKAQQESPGPVSQMLGFVARLFDTLLPGLDYFRVGPVIVTDVPLSTPEFFVYVATVGVYGLLYTAIVLVLGLVLFEDRDLA
jgi:hypothetical protein